jgi:hypothetical protein
MEFLRYVSDAFVFCCFAFAFGLLGVAIYVVRKHFQAIREQQAYDHNLRMKVKEIELKEAQAEVEAAKPQKYYLNLQYLLLDLQDVKLLKSGTQMEVCLQELPNEIQWHVHNMEDALHRKMERQNIKPIK